MDNKNIYIVSFGDSDKYSVAFSGTKEELMRSEEFRHIVDRLKECLKTDFPAGDYDDLISPKVSEASPSDRDYPELTPDAVRHIEHSLKREGEVLNSNRRLDNDAPYSNIN